MESPIKDRTNINMSKTVEKYADIIGELFPIHDLTGCDTVTW
jgi:hypothetical protein